MNLTLIIFTLTSAFLSGLLALFAPCCITFLLPSYFASVFQARKRIVYMTFVFFLGLATVLVPISMGIAWLASFLKEYHEATFIIGGSLLIFYGILAFFGKTVMLPFKLSQPDVTKPTNTFGVYSLGIFSGVASSCCAPVLAGMLTLTALTASLPLALMISLIYILGMTMPLFVLALVWDQKRIGQSKLFKGTVIRFRIGGWRHVVHSTHLLIAALFVTVGSFVLYTSVNGEAAVAAPWQVAISATMQSKVQGLSRYASHHPVASLILYGLVVLIWVLLMRAAQRKNAERGSND